MPARRRPKLALVGLLCLILGGGGLYLAWTSATATEEILVAANDIAAGQVLQPTDVKSRSIIIGPQVATMPVDYPIAGLVAWTDIAMGEPLVASAIGQPLPNSSGLVRMAVVVAVGLAPVETIEHGQSASLFGPAGELISGTIDSQPELLPDAARYRFDVLVSVSEAPLLTQWVVNQSVVVTVP